VVELRQIIDAFTRNVGNVTSNGSLYVNSVGTTTVQVAGVGSGTFTDITDVFDNILGASRISYGAIQSEFHDTRDPAFTTYNLSTAVGPISNRPIYNPEFDYQTTAGAFRLYSIEGNSTFTATLNPTSSTPEPGSLALNGGIGKTGIGFLRRRAKKH